jgi:baculoviral IAP repeat-containing protein 2/3
MANVDTRMQNLNSIKKELIDDSSKCPGKRIEKSSSNIVTLPFQILTMLSTLVNKLGVHTASYMNAAGFQYTGDRDTAKCTHCGLEISHWTLDMNPFTIHSERNPNCSFIRSLKPSSLSQNNSSSSPSTINTKTTLISNEQGNPSKRQKTETVNTESISNTLVETDILQQVRRRTFSHWPHRTIPSSAQMIEAGFFNCNVGDRVICTYCNLICQQWTPHTDDPCEVHKTLSPHCIYVKAKLIRPAASSIMILNESPVGAATANSHSLTVHNHDPLRSNEIVHTAACNPAYTEIPKRQASFATWPAENLPSVDDLVRAGFFYTGTKTIVTCFYCNGSLQNWGPNDNPMIEHARWFPHCAYAKQLCGDELYRKIQESKRAQQERAKATESKEKSGSTPMITTNTNTNSRQLHIPDESTLSRLVAAR